MMGIANQVGQGLVHALGIFALKARFHGGVGAHAEEDGIVFLKQLVKGDVLTDSYAQLELYAHTF